MKRLIIDMDDVIADATGQFINYYEREFSVRMKNLYLQRLIIYTHINHFSRLNNCKEVAENFYNVQNDDRLLWPKLSVLNNSFIESI